ncbi:opioid growth factor receptor-like [Hyperolius riggenbachi]|uniref:opioid growth factor receptor-like n=1 Tax=Hyperolius riggenbachi TaxID=752182 RepID=UPI0035A348D3
MAARDLQRYRRGHPDSREQQNLQNYRDDGYPELMPNVRFYRNEIPFQPNGTLIELLHYYWKDDYYELEMNHNYIQWLFPLRERGVNPYASPLTPHEIQVMRSDDVIRRRLLQSYKLMLGFYGIMLLDENTGDVWRAENWMERFHNLNTNTHNNLRITRILKCLGELGYEHFQAPLVRFFLEETLCSGNLQNVKRSALDHFMFTVKDNSECQALVQFARDHYRPKYQFELGPAQVLQERQPVKNHFFQECQPFQNIFLQERKPFKNIFLQERQPVKNSFLQKHQSVKNSFLQEYQPVKNHNKEYVRSANTWKSFLHKRKRAFIIVLLCFSIYVWLDLWQAYFGNTEDKKNLMCSRKA